MSSEGKPLWRGGSRPPPVTVGDQVSLSLKDSNRGLVLRLSAHQRGRKQTCKGTSPLRCLLSTETPAMHSQA